MWISFDFERSCGDHLILSGHVMITQSQDVMWMIRVETLYLLSHYSDNLLISTYLLTVCF